MKNIQTKIVAIIFVMLFCGTVAFFWFKAVYDIDSVIANDILLLAEKLEQIHADCEIISFEHQKNFIDFLNVISFEGSEVGPLNLTYPKNWKGPYLKDNPTIQEIYYQVVKTKYGYFVVPGPNVRLSSGLVIGKDIIFDEDADIEKMIVDGQLRSRKGRPLAQPILKKLYYQPLPLTNY